MMLWTILILLVIGQQSLQDCPEEESPSGMTVKWSKTPPAYNVESEPLCYVEDNLVVRNCTEEGKWIPAADEVQPCAKIVKIFEQASCPPGFNKISETNTEYCYKISAESNWNSPCFTSGGASVITDLDEDETNSLIDSLVAANISRYFWLPANRQKVFNPVTWVIPGPNWGTEVITNTHLKYNNFFWKNCLALDIEQRLILTHTCAEKYPSLCFYINKVHYPAHCPEGYHAFRYKLDNGTCFGIEKAEVEGGLNYAGFTKNKCKNPMISSSINKFIFTKIAEIYNLTDDEWCWFKITNKDFESSNDSESGSLEGIINNIGSLGLIDSSYNLSCIACEADVIYGETEFIFEFNSEENKIYLTIYFPSGLWKYDDDDKGIQCFSDAKGFVKVVDISDIPHLVVQKPLDGDDFMEKVVYTVDLVTDRSAQYWCEGHTFDFSLLRTEVIVVNPKGNEVHVYSLTLNCYNYTIQGKNVPDIDNMLSIICDVLNVEKVLLMDVLELTDQYSTVLLHVHAAIPNIHDDEALNIVEQFNNLKEIAIEQLPTVNCSFISLKSSVYCLPTISSDYVDLDWELTPIGHISAPKQFCLRANGLPVKRQCTGSYHTGGTWGPVEGQCDCNYIPSEKTTFLYNVVKGHVSENYTTSFLTDGLEFVLNDVKVIIPADIYYLSMSLEQITNMAQNNDSCVDIGDIENIAWVMDRVMNFDYDYMELAQTLNSTNVILNSVNNIIELIANQVNTSTTDVQVEYRESKPEIVENAYQLAIKPQFIVQISYPELTNITGLAIYRLSTSDFFNKMQIMPLYANTTLEEVLAIKNLEVAAWLPNELLMSLEVNKNDTEVKDLRKNNLHIITSIFRSDVVFQELNSKNHAVNSRIVGISIPGFLPNLKYPLPLVFRQLNETDSEKMCSFWDFQSAHSSALLGLWKSKGCYPLKPIPGKKHLTVCECYHLTHFSQLLVIPFTGSSTSVKTPQTDNHIKALNVITLMGCALSLSGVVGIWITAMVFSNWRRKAGTKILLQLSTAIALPLLFIIYSNIDERTFMKENDLYLIVEEHKVKCIVLGALLHYCILASFMWMLITAVLQFIRYVRVLGVSRPSRYMIKFATIGWGIPLIPVIIVLSIQVDSYIPSTSSYKPMCYPNGYSFLLGLLLPICLILLVNVTMFVLVLYSISRSSNEKMKPTDMDHVYAQLRLSIFLFFLLGLTWIFGIFSFSTNLTWSYLFCLTATLQGFILFVYFIVCDPATRSLWITLVKIPLSANSTKSSISSISSSN